MWSVDPRFRQMGHGARRRRLRLVLLRGLVVTVLLAGAGLVWVGWDKAPTHLADADQDQTLIVPEPMALIAPVVRTDLFTDIAGDPILIAGQDETSPTGRKMVLLPAPLRKEGGGQGPVQASLVQADLFTQDRTLVAALPTSHEEFALFQAQRSREQPAETVELQHSLSSSTVFTRDTATRDKLWQDLIVQIHQPGDVAAVLQAKGFDPATAGHVSARLRDQLQLAPELPAGSLLALRYRMQKERRQVLQSSLYQDGTYRGSLAMAASGQLVAGADPWADQPLQRQSATAPESNGELRLLDAIYSAALRHGVPGALVGEAIAMMARVYDLEGFAAPQDQLSLVIDYGQAEGAGQILFAGIFGPSGKRRCYVLPDKVQGFSCFAPEARVAASPAFQALVPPVAGVLQQRFSPSSDGRVIWRVRQGAPVVAVAAGRVVAVEAQGKDKRVILEHPGGMRSLYHGLQNLPPKLRIDGLVRQGESIGQAALTGGELAFQLLLDGQAVDPLPLLAGGSSVLASAAVEALIGRIIHVESGGNPTARNPLSTATGLGQFIESTWLRLLGTYRSDLVATLDRAALLDLRLDPALSRQMLRHLAQENEAFLRRKGHRVTAGNLYLAHFLGPQGASRILSADPDLAVANVMEGAVILANPFLRSYRVADLQHWADRKMATAAVLAATSAPADPPLALTPEIMAFVAAIDDVLAASSR